MQLRALFEEEEEENGFGLASADKKFLQPMHQGSVSLEDFSMHKIPQQDVSTRLDRSTRPEGSTGPEGSSRPAFKKSLTMKERVELLNFGSFKVLEEGRLRRVDTATLETLLESSPSGVSTLVDLEEMKPGKISQSVVADASQSVVADASRSVGKASIEENVVGASKGASKASRRNLSFELHESDAGLSDLARHIMQESLTSDPANKVPSQS